MNYALKNTTIAPATQPTRQHLMSPVASPRLLDQDADAAAAAKAAADKAAADKAAADKAAADKAAADATAKAATEAKEKAELEEKLKGLSDSEAKLLKENMAQKAKIRELAEQAEKTAAALKNYDGIDPAQIKQLIETNNKAEEAKKKAEEDNLKKAGDFDRLKAMMAEQHKAETEKLNKTLTDKDGALTAAQKTINELTVGSAFSNSTFLKDGTVLTPSIARSAFEGHFDVVDGKVVAYDKPRGASGRTPLVNSMGESVPFEDAIKKIVESSPDKDRLLRSGIKSGANTGTNNVRTGGDDKDNAPRGMARIKNALSSGALKKA